MRLSWRQGPMCWRRRPSAVRVRSWANTAFPTRYITRTIRRRNLLARWQTSYSTDLRPRYVAGSMGPTGMLPSADDPTLSNITYQQLKEIYKEQAKPLVEGGVDLLIIETTQDILELKAAIAGAVALLQGERAVGADPGAGDARHFGRMLLGTDIVAALTTLEYLAGARDRAELLDRAGAHARADPLPGRELAASWVSCIPNAGLPLNVGGQAVYPLEAGADGRDLCRVRHRVRRERGRWLLRHRRLSTSGRWWRRWATNRKQTARPCYYVPPRVQRHARHRPAAGARAR